MSASNDRIISHPVTPEYEEGWDRVFGKENRMKFCLMCGVSIDEYENPYDELCERCRDKSQDVADIRREAE